MIELVRSASALAEVLRASPTRPVELVPTMGALHAGHQSLIEAARRGGGHVVVSVFVNPYQFNDPADLLAYPRDLDADLAAANGAGATVLFAPEVDEVYPAGPEAYRVDPGPAAKRYEGERRPGHFVGVATVVTRLFELVGPQRAYFGEKDFQQLVVVRQLAAAAWPDLLIVGCPTVREPDGLALSSRNARLTADERGAAPVLYRALLRGSELIAAGERDPMAIEEAVSSVVRSEARAALEYAAVVDASDCAPLPVLEGELRILVAATIGGVRLIDNVASVA